MYSWSSMTQCCRVGRSWPRPPPLTCPSGCQRSTLPSGPARGLHLINVEIKNSPVEPGFDAGHTIAVEVAAALAAAAPAAAAAGAAAPRPDRRRRRRCSRPDRRHRPRRHSHPHPRGPGAHRLDEASTWRPSTPSTPPALSFPPDG